MSKRCLLPRQSRAQGARPEERHAIDASFWPTAGGRTRWRQPYDGRARRDALTRLAATNAAAQVVQADFNLSAARAQFLRALGQKE
jgi:hypothetical protein